MKFELEAAIAVLRRTPPTLRAWLSGLPREWIQANEGPDTWSAYDIVGHLLHGDRTDWMARVRIILEHGDSRAFDSFDRFAQFEESRGKSLDDLLAEFESVRTRSLAELAALRLTAQQLELRGQHPALGSVTLGQLLATWAAHDLDHLGQIARVMCKQYSDAVGPWREYLTLMRAGKR